MTISTQTRLVNHSGNGVAVNFTYPFKVTEEADLKVYKLVDGAWTLQTVTTDYTVTGIGNPGGGTVTFATPPESGSGNVRLLRRVQLTQLVDYILNDDFPAEVHEGALDKLTMAIQDYYQESMPSDQAAEFWDALGRRVSNVSDPVGDQDAVTKAWVLGQVLTGTGAAVLQELASTAAGKGGALVGFKQSESGAVARTVCDKLLEIVSVKDFGAKGDGINDDTSAIQAAINSFTSGRGKVYFPAGTYKVTSTITVSKDRVHLVGAGSWATQILFAPAANGTCFKFSAGSSVLYQGSCSGFSFYSNDSTYTKTAIENVDTSGYLFDDIVVGGSVAAIPGAVFWSGGAGSRGIWNKGREACKLSRLYIFADKPIEISDNPNSTIDIDHFHFEDTYLGAANNPCVLINDGVNLTNVTFDGYNAWVLGTDGLYWVNTTSPGVSQTLVLRGIRFEQGKNSDSWCIRIEHNNQLQGLTIEDCQGGLERNGYRLRKCLGVNIRNNINTGGAGRTVLDVDSTVNGLTLLECFWQAASTANMTGQVLVWGTPKPASSAPLPPTARYQSTTLADKRTSTELANGGYMITVPNGGVIGLGPNTMAGMLTVVDSEYLSAIFSPRGVYKTVSEVADPVGVFSAVAGTASMTNVYWSAANSRYELQNNRGASRNYLIIFDGTYTGF